MIDAPSILAGLSIGSSLGVIAGALFAGGRAQEKIDALGKEIAAHLEIVRCYRARNSELLIDSANQKDAYRKQGRELAELRAEKQRRLAPLKAANEARHAKAEAAKAAARELQNARHAEMKRLVGEVI